MGKMQEHHVHNVGERETHRVDPEHHEKFREPERLERLRPGELVEAFEPEKGWTVLDVGCGDGLFFEPLSDAVGPTGAVIGLDVESGMVKAARASAGELGRDNVRVLRITDEEMDLPDDHADAAIVVNTLHEMASPRLTLGELHRVLRPGGRVLVFDRHKEETGPEGPPVHHLISREEARELLDGAGFDFQGDVDWDPDMYCLILQNRR